MYLMFRNYEDIRNIYGIRNCRNLSNRLFKILDIHRQPRPHLSLDVYANKRCLLIQRIKTIEIVPDFKMSTKRKKYFNNYHVFD